MTDEVPVTPETPNPEPSPTPPLDAIPPTDAPETPAETPAETPKPDEKAEDTPEQETGDLLFQKKKEDEPADGEEPEQKDEDSTDDDGESPEDKEGDKEDTPEIINVEELEIPENMPVPDALKEDLDTFAKEMTSPDLTAQERMQKAVDLHVKAQQHSLEVWNDTKKQWADETLADPDIGGKNWDSTQIRVDDAMNKAWANPVYGGSPELLKEFQDDVKMLGLGNKLSFIKGMNNIAKMIGEDKQGDSSGSNAGAELSAAEKLYGKDGTGRG